MAEAFIAVTLLFIIYLLVLTIFLKIALNIVGGRKTDFGEVFITALIIAIIAALFSYFGGFLGLLLAIVGLILCLYFIGERHDIGMCLALIVIIVAVVVFIIVAIIVGIILGIFGIAFSFLI